MQLSSTQGQKAIEAIDDVLTGIAVLKEETTDDRGENRDGGLGGNVMPSTVR